MRAKTVSDISPAVSLTPSVVSECMASICFGRAEGKTEGKRKKGKKWMKTGRNLKRERRIKMIWRLIFFTYIITKTTLMYQILSIWLQTNEMDRTVWNTNRKQFCFFSLPPLSPRCPSKFLTIVCFQYMSRATYALPAETIIILEIKIHFSCSEF